MKFQSIVASVLTIACSFCVLTSLAATTVNVSTLTPGESRAIGGTLKMDAEFNLGTSTLTLTEVSAITKGSTFTGLAGSVLDIEFPSGLDSSLGAANLFDGGMKLIIRGSGQIRIPKKSTHTGGTVIYGGVVDGITSNTRALSTTCLPFGAVGSEVEICGGALTIHAYNNLSSYYSFVLNGGTLRNDVDYANSSWMTASITLKSDSTIESAAATNFKPSSILGSGKLSITGDGVFTIGKALSMKEIGLAVSAPFALGSYDLEVADYEVTAETAPTGTGTIKVNGTFKPQTENFCSVILQNGASIDLTSWEEKAVVNAGGNQVAFAEAATITLDVGDRVVNDGDTVLIWADGTEDSAYEGRLFKLIGANVASGLAVEASAEGIKAAQASKEIVTAHWKGEGDVSNWRDSANWTCYNAADTIIPNGVPGDDLTVVFTDDVSDVPFGNDFPFAGARLTDAILSKDVDWSAFDLGKITQDSVLDIGENTLKIAKESGITTCAATFTSTAEDGVFEIEVADGASFTNATINLAGKISLKKTGLGALVLTKEGQTYAGKTIVEAGKLVCGTLNVTNAKTFGEGKEIDLAANTILDPAGSIYWGAVVINMNGGMISNTVEQTGLGSTSYNANIANPFSPILKLNASATLATSESFNFQGEVIASGNAELTIDIPSGKAFLWDASNAKSFKLNVTGGGFFKVWHKTTRTYYSNYEGLILDMKDASFNLYQASGSGYPATLGVMDYIASSQTGTHVNGGTLEVYGTFVPTEDYFFGCKMMNGSIIDLSGKDEAWGDTSKATGKKTIEFKEGASDSLSSVTINLGTRELQLGEKVIEWTAKPNNVAFTFTRNGDPVDVEARALTDGLYYGQEIITRAEWTGEAGNGDLSDSKNWKDGILPTGEIQAKFTGDISKIVAPAEDTFACSEFYFENAELTQTADFSWIDLNKITDDSVIDINGQTLKIASTNSISTTSATITDSVGGGTVEFTVGEGVVHTNTLLALEGGLKFVKQGKGVFVAAKYPQLYTNVTEVAEGGIRCEDGANMNATDKKSPFGESFIVMLDEGTFLDPAGSYLWGYHTIEMNGGMISNTVKEIGASSTGFNASYFLKPFNPILVLKADSLFVSPVQFNFNGVIQPNGNKLTVCTAEEFRWAPMKVNGAEVEFTGGGSLVTLKNMVPVMTDISLVMNNFTFDVGTLMVVSNYTAAAGTKDPVPSKDAWHGVGGMTVSGTFTPTASKFFGCQMLDGSTINLSGKTGTWSTTTDSSYKNGPLTVTFAEGATVTIDVNGRRFGGKNKKIVSWTAETKPANLDTLTFVLDAQSKQDGYELDVRDDGIYAKHLGIIMMLK